MTYIYYIGIDISKDFFDIVVHGEAKKSAQFKNNITGFKKFFNDYKEKLAESLVILEATGGYETQLLHFLSKKNIKVHRADPTKSKNFVRSLGQLAKTDRIDATALARYGFERHDRLAIFQMPEKEQEMLMAFLARRADLVAMRVQERNRRKHPNYAKTLFCVDQMLATLDAQIENINAKIEKLISESETLFNKVKVLTQVKGVGKQTAYTLIGAMPELGSLTRKQAASLAGCAPHPKDSGKTTGYRSIRGGRIQVKSALFMAAMSARNFNPQLKPFYERLVSNGKKPIVALTAIMRKIITILNAILRDYQLQCNHGR